MILALAQMLPTHPRRVIRTGRFSDFQQICGLLERESYRAGHAACHATMNGFSRVLAVDADVADRTSMQAALTSLFEAGPFDALVFCAPLEAEILNFVLEICEKKSKDFDFLLLLDPERGVDIDALIAAQKSLPKFARYAYPWVRTLSPGRRSYESLPPSCLAAGLCLGLSPKLRGVHELDELGYSDAEDLADAGLAVMRSTGLQSGIVLLRSEPTVSEAPDLSGLEQDLGRLEIGEGLSNRLDEELRLEDPEEMLVQARLLEAIDKKCAALLAQSTSNGPLLWSSLRRSAISVLRDAQSRGVIKAYHVRCDEETASWGDENNPVIEILLSFEKRVKELRFSLGKLDSQ